MEAVPHLSMCATIHPSSMYPFTHTSIHPPIVEFVSSVIHRAIETDKCTHTQRHAHTEQRYTLTNTTEKRHKQTQKEREMEAQTLMEKEILGETERRALA